MPDSNSGSEPDLARAYAYTRSGSDPELELQALDGFPVDEFLEVGLVGELDLAVLDLRGEARDLGLEHHEERVRGGKRARAGEGRRLLQRDERADRALVVHGEREASVAGGGHRVDGARLGEADARRLRGERPRAAADVKARVVRRGARKDDEQRDAAVALQRRVRGVRRE